MPTSGELALRSFDAWRRGDLERALRHSSPDIEIAQPSGLPDAKTYYGHQGVRDAFADWSQQWESFDVLAVDLVGETDGGAILFTKHQLQARDGVEFVLDVYNVFAYEDGLATAWDMFMTLDEAWSRLQELPTGAERNE